MQSEKEAVVKIWREYFDLDPEDEGDPIQVFVINETTVSALRWHEPDGCRLVDTINLVSKA